MSSVRLLSSSRLQSLLSSDPDLETTTCPLCSGHGASIIHLFEPFNVVSCNNCSLVYLNPRLKEAAMKMLYRDSKYFTKGDDSGYADYSYQEQCLRITFRRFLKRLRSYGMASGRLLEIGCGYGFFLDEARDYFSFRAGTELSEEAGSSAGRLSGAHIHIGSVDSLPGEFYNFDLIVLINVIEHIYNPLHFIVSLKGRLAKNGKIVIATPDIGSLWHRIMGKRWPSFKIPEHIAFYTEGTLSLLMKKAGFYKTLRIPFPHAFPLELITQKLGISVFSRLAKRPVWLPKTMITMAGECYNG